MTERIKLTEKHIKALPPPASGRVTIYDASVPQLALRVTHTGTKTWYVVAWSKTGGQRFISLGAAGPIPVTLARELAQETLVKLRRGVDPIQEVREKKEALREAKAGGKVPLADALKLHLKLLGDRKRDSGHIHELKRVVTAAITHGVTDLAHASVAVKATLWLDSLTVSEPTRHRYRVHLCAVGKTALKNWPAKVLPRDPFLALTGQGANIPAPAVFDPVEAITLLSDQALAQPGGRLWAFLLLTGCRFKEATWARWDRINLGRSTFDVVPPNEAEYAAGSRVKRMKPRTIALQDELVSLLTEWQVDRIASTPFLFPVELRTRPHVYNTMSFRAHLAALGIPLAERRIHTLRHTRQTLGIACGEDSLRLRLSMGHAGEDMGAHYGRLAMRWRGLLSGWDGQLRLRDPAESARILASLRPVTDSAAVVEAGA